MEKNKIQTLVRIGRGVEELLKDGFIKAMTFEESIELSDKVADLIINFENTAWYLDDIWAANNINLTNYVEYEVLKEHATDLGKRLLTTRITRWKNDNAREPRMYAYPIEE